MIIDFHTHIFPEAIVKRTIQQLETSANITAYTNGMLSGLKESMKQAGVDYSIVLPVATKPSQFQTINKYAASINGKDGILSFGGIHPDSPDYKTELEQIRSYGLAGIKLHPDYQKTFIDDPKYLQLITYAVDLGLIVVIHAGIDIGFPNPVHCPPEKSLHMLSYVESHAKHPSDAKIVLAHVGGHGQWDDVERYLVGTRAYLDLAFCYGRIPQDQLIRIIQTHGADRILYATDSPWSDQKQSIAYVKSLPLSEEDICKILGGNATKLLFNAQGFPAQHSVV